jgi:TonB family protein
MKSVHWSLAFTFFFSFHLSLAQAETVLVSPKLTRTEECRKPQWPKSTAEDGEEGMVMFDLLVGADGSPLSATLVISSGDKRLDAASEKALMKCMFLPGTVNGNARTMLLRYSFVWYLIGDRVRGQGWDRIAESARRGNRKALYSYAHFLLMEPETRALGIEIIKSMANAGFSLAQHELAKSYESGRDVERNSSLAEAWYAKAAEQGDPPSIERMRLIGDSKSSNE